MNTEFKYSMSGFITCSDSSKVSSWPSSANLLNCWRGIFLSARRGSKVLWKYPTFHCMETKMKFTIFLTCLEATPTPHPHEGEEEVKEKESKGIKDWTTPILNRWSWMFFVNLFVCSVQLPGSAGAALIRLSEPTCKDATWITITGRNLTSS